MGSKNNIIMSIIAFLAYDVPTSRCPFIGHLFTVNMLKDNCSEHPSNVLIMTKAVYSDMHSQCSVHVIYM